MKMFDLRTMCLKKNVRGLDPNTLARHNWGQRDSSQDRTRPCSRDERRTPILDIANDVSSYGPIMRPCVCYHCSIRKNSKEALCMPGEHMATSTITSSIQVGP
jgi:hypothetical protein